MVGVCHVVDGWDAVVIFVGRGRERDREREEEARKEIKPMNCCGEEDGRDEDSGGLFRGGWVGIMVDKLGFRRRQFKFESCGVGIHHQPRSLLNAYLYMHTIEAKTAVLDSRAPRPANSIPYGGRYFQQPRPASPRLASSYAITGMLLEYYRHYSYYSVC